MGGGDLTHFSGVPVGEQVRKHVGLQRPRSFLRKRLGNYALITTMMTIKLHENVDDEFDRRLH